MIGPKDSDVIQGTLKSVRTHDLAHEILSSHDIHTRYPILHPNNNEIGVYEHEAGYLIPEICVLTYQEKAIDYGADLKFQETVVKWEININTNIIEITTNTNTNICYCKQLVLSVGSWIKDNNINHNNSIINSIHKIERKVLYWFRSPPSHTSHFHVRYICVECDMFVCIDMQCICGIFVYCVRFLNVSTMHVFTCTSLYINRSYRCIYGTWVNTAISTAFPHTRLPLTPPPLQVVVIAAVLKVIVVYMMRVCLSTQL